MKEPASAETKERLKKSNKLTITSHPPNKENDKNSEYLSTEMPHLRDQFPCYINGVLVSTEADSPDDDHTNSLSNTFSPETIIEQLIPIQRRPKQRVCIDPETIAKVDFLIEKHNDGYSCKDCEYTTYDRAR